MIFLPAAAVRWSEVLLDPGDGSRLVEDSLKKKRLLIRGAALGGVSALYLGLVFRTPSFLIGTPEYQWPVLRHAVPARIPAAAAVLVLAAAAGVVLFYRFSSGEGERFRAARTYVSLFLLGICFQLGPFLSHRMGFPEIPLRVYLPDHTSYFTDAVKIEDLSSWLRDFPDLAPRSATHTRTHPPGAVLLFYGGIKVAQSCPRLADFYLRVFPRAPEALKAFNLTPAQAAGGALAGFALMLAAAAAACFAFALGRLLGMEKEGFAATLIFMSAPAFSHKTPVLDHGLALLILACLWFLVRAVVERKIHLAALAGALAGMGLWFGTSVLAAIPLGLVFAAAAIIMRRKESGSWNKLIALFFFLAVLFCGSALAVLLFMGAFMKSNYLEVYRAITEIGWRMNNLASGRKTPWMWMAFNPYELLAWAGAPLAALFLAALARTGAQAWKRRWSDLNPWFIAFFIFLVALDLSGRVCYEASRLVWFAFPLLAIFGAGELLRESEERGGSFFLLSLVLLLQVAHTLVFRMLF